MSGSRLLLHCEKLYGSRDLYTVFDIPRTASALQIKKAYYKLSLKVHPDKVEEKCKEEAAEKFKLLCKLHEILGNESKRALYDRTGDINEDDDFGFSDNQDFYDYWRELFPTVTADDINKFADDYKDSNEELSDIKSAYLAGKGDMQTIIDSVLCATIEDEDRFRAIITRLIALKELPSFKKFVNESGSSKKKRMQKAAKEAREAEKAAKELKGGSLEGYNDLAMAIRKNREKQSNMISYLEQKYSRLEESDDQSASRKGSKKLGLDKGESSVPKHKVKQQAVDDRMEPSEEPSRTSKIKKPAAKRQKRT